MEIWTLLWWSLAAILVVVIWIVGICFGYWMGRRSGMVEGYEMCLQEWRRSKASVFASLYGGASPRRDS
jgi:hypothetical protein